MPAVGATFALTTGHIIGDHVMQFVELEDQMRKSSLVTYRQYNQVPATSGVYAAWLEGESRCLYIGKAGNTPNGNLKKRITAHFSGQRGSDQFCL